MVLDLDVAIKSDVTLHTGRKKLFWLYALLCTMQATAVDSRSQESFPLKRSVENQTVGFRISKWGSGPSSSAVGARIEAPMRVGGVWREEVRVRTAGCGDGCPAPH